MYRFSVPFLPVESLELCGELFLSRVLSVFSGNCVRVKELMTSGIVIIFGIPLFYANRYLCVDQQDFDLSSIASEGAMPAICLFFVSWIVAYSAIPF